MVSDLSNKGEQQKELTPLSSAIPSAMSVTAKNVVLMRVVIKVLRNVCGNGL